MSQPESGHEEVTNVNALRRLYRRVRLYRRAGQGRDLLGWLVLTAVGLGLTVWAVRLGAHLGTAGAPFLGRYRWQFSVLSALAPAVAGAVLLAARLGWFDRVRWGPVLVRSYLSALAWAVAPALT